MYTISENLTWILNSSHTLKFGGWVEHAEQNNNDQIGQQNGQITFLDSGHPLSTGLAVANVATGAFDNYIERGPAAYTLLRSKSLELYAQDTWKATPNLTFEIGVRYSYHQPWYAKWNDIANFDAAYYNPANRAIVIYLFELVVTALSAWLLAGETLTLNEWCGGALIIAAGVLSDRIGGAAPPSPDAVTALTRARL